MKQKEIIGLIFREIDERGDIPNSKEEDETFTGFIEYLKKEGFITSETSKDMHYMEIRNRLMMYNYLSIKTGFEHGFKTAAALLTQGK